MRATCAIFMLMAAVSLPAIADSAATLELRSDVEATGGTVGLDQATVVQTGDPLLKKQIEAVMFRPEGLPGQVQRYSRDDLAALIAVQAPEASGRFDWAGAPWLRVHVPGTALDLAALAGQARVALKSWLASRYADYEVELVPGQEAEEASVAPDEVASVRPFAGPPSTRTAMWIDIRRSGEGGGRSLPIWFAVKAWAPAPVAARDILPGTRPAPADLGSATVDMAAVGGRELLAAADDQESIAVGYIRRGQVLTSDRFRRASPVQVGDDVRLHVKTGSVQVEVRGLALESGGNGQRVRVRNVASGEVLVAYVTGPGLVEVAP